MTQHHLQNKRNNWFNSHQQADYDGSSQVELNKNEFEFTLPQSNRKVTFQQ